MFCQGTKDKKTKRQKDKKTKGQKDKRTKCQKVERSKSPGKRKAWHGLMVFVLRRQNPGRGRRKRQKDEKTKRQKDKRAKCQKVEKSEGRKTERSKSPGKRKAWHGLMVFVLRRQNPGRGRRKPPAV